MQSGKICGRNRGRNDELLDFDRRGGCDRRHGPLSRALSQVRELDSGPGPQLALGCLGYYD